MTEFYDVDLRYTSAEEQIQQLISDERRHLRHAYRDGLLSQSDYWIQLMELEERYLTDRNRRKSLCCKILDFICIEG